ncbi:MAG: hypothetical protein PVF58_14170 [Candidatus Methanofastidiosia archaeon]|jgi:hypothetical protein
MNVLCWIFGHKKETTRQKEEIAGDILDTRYTYCTRCKRLFKWHAPLSGIYLDHYEIDSYIVTLCLIKQLDVELSEEQKRKYLKFAYNEIEGMHYTQKIIPDPWRPGKHKQIEENWSLEKKLEKLHKLIWGF